MTPNEAIAAAVAELDRTGAFFEAFSQKYAAEGRRASSAAYTEIATDLMNRAKAATNAAMALRKLQESKP